MTGLRKHVIAAMFLLAAQGLWAGDPEVMDVTSGQVVWSNSLTSGYAFVEWTDSLTNAWSSSWYGQSFLSITGSIMSARLPVYYRVMNLGWGVVDSAWPVRMLANGDLSWTVADPGAWYYVEWAANSSGPWTPDWLPFTRSQSAGSSHTLSVPRYFRVREDPVSWVLIGEVHNAADSTGYGVVNYPFAISKYEVTNEEYARFLNAVDPNGVNSRMLFNSQMASDPRGGISNHLAAAAGSRYQVKPNMADKPVVFVSFWDACRYVNWMQNGCGAGSTERGTYTLKTLYPNNGTVTRAPGARVFLPSENEWYKAAYYRTNGNYTLYPLKNDSLPTIAQCNASGSITNDTTSIANYAFGAVWNGVTGNVTSVGSGGVGSESALGVADMAGNVFEWTEGIFETAYRSTRGGCWYSQADYLQSGTRKGSSPSNDYSSVGFRIACAYLSGTNYRTAANSP